MMTFLRAYMQWKRIWIFLIFITTGIPFFAQGLSVDFLSDWECGLKSPRGLGDFTSRGFVIEGWGVLGATLESVNAKEYAGIEPFLPYRSPKIFQNINTTTELGGKIHDFLEGHPNYALQIAVFFPTMWNEKITDPFYLLMGRPAKESDAVVSDVEAIGMAAQELNAIYCAPDESQHKVLIKALLQGETTPLKLEQRFCFYKTQMTGAGVDQSVGASLKGFIDLAGQGHAEAAFYVGDIYYRGLRVKADVGQAFIYYKQAADGASARAQHNVGIAYKKGEGVGVDLVEAFKYYKLAADQGLIEAQKSVSEAYGKGLGVKMDLVESFKYWSLFNGVHETRVWFGDGCAIL